MIRKENKDEKRSSTVKKTAAAKKRTETKSGRYAVREDKTVGRFSFGGAAAVAPEERRKKNVVLTQTKLERVKDLLGTRTESEAIEKALERVIDEESRNREAWNAHEAFAREMIENKFEIEDVFGRLEA